MIKWITNWFNKHKTLRVKNAYTQGYDYAAGVLLRGEVSVDELEAMYAPNFIKEDRYGQAFDKGMAAAVARLLSVGISCKPKPKSYTHTFTNTN